MLYFHKTLRLFLVVYVDDFKLAGPKENLRKGWDLIRKGLTMEDPTPLGVFLGCDHVREDVRLSGGKSVSMIQYGMKGFMASCVERYMEHAPNARLRPVDTPFLPEDQGLSTQGMPCSEGPLMECPS